MKTIIVTGGAGFIGSNFIHYLMNKSDYRVLNFDALTYAGNLDNLKGISADRYTFIKGDITEKTDVKLLENVVNPTLIINFAAETHVDQSFFYPKKFIKTNVLGVQNLLDFAKEKTIGFLQISTDEVYGDNQIGQDSDQMMNFAPSSIYAASKASAELLVQSYRKMYGIDVGIVRCSNNYGPRQYPEKLIPLVISKAYNDKKIPIYGKGDQKRNWLYVEDCCRAIIKVMEKKTAGEIFNVGGKTSIENLELVKKLLTLLNKSDRLIEHVMDRQCHDVSYQMNCDKIKQKLKWTPDTDLDQGLKKTIKWYEKNNSWQKQLSSSRYKNFEKINYGKK